MPLTTRLHVELYFGSSSPQFAIPDPSLKDRSSASITLVNHEIEAEWKKIHIDIFFKIAYTIFMVFFRFKRHSRSPKFEWRFLFTCIITNFVNFRQHKKMET